jgi:hypothetical protein
LGAKAVEVDSFTIKTFLFIARQASAGNVEKTVVSILVIFK